MTNEEVVELDKYIKEKDKKRHTIKYRFRFEEICALSVKRFVIEFTQPILGRTASFYEAKIIVDASLEI